MTNRDNPHSVTNQFDLAKETFNLLKSMINEYQDVKNAYQQISNMTSDTLKSAYEQESLMKEIRGQLNRLITQQAEIILEAKLIHKDLDRLLDLFGDVATYSKDDSPPKWVVYGDAG